MEQWKPVVGYEGFYEVSDLGSVRSIDRIVECGPRMHRLKGKPLSRAIANNGYPIVTLTKLGRMKTFTVHVLILEAFIGPRPTKAHQGCHDDGIRSNSVLGNLRWGTPSENREDSRRHGTLCIGSKRPFAKLNDEIVEQIRKDTRTMTAIARHHGISLTTVWKVKNRVSWAHVE